MRSAKALEAIVALREATSVAAKWRVVRPAERRLKRAMSKAFVKQGREFLEDFDSLRSHFAEAMTLTTPPLPEDEWGPLFDQAAAETMDDFVEPIQDAIETAMPAGAATAGRELGIEAAFNLKNPRAVAYIEQHGAELVRGINETTREGLRTLLRIAADEGWSYDKTARMIKREFEGFAGLKPQLHIKDRATLVAVTEVGNAYEEGSSIVVRDLADAGLRMEKRWLNVGDSRVSDGCRENSAAGWIPFDDAFPSGHAQPLRFPGCRCTTQHRRAR